MLARIGNELYWLGRYVARAEHTARMLEGVYAADLQGRPEEPTGVGFTWTPVEAIMGVSASSEGVLRKHAHPLVELVLNSDLDVSVRACTERARESAKALRDVVPHDMWEALNTLYIELATVTPDTLLHDPLRVFRPIRDLCTLFWGLGKRAMLRDEAAAFLRAGAHLEGASMMVRMLRVALPLPFGDVQNGGSKRTIDQVELDGAANAVLRAVGGEQAFRRSSATPADTASIAKFLIFERDYPNSVGAHIADLYSEIDRADEASRSSPPVLRLQRFSADLEFHSRSQQIVSRDSLAARCLEIQSELDEVDREIADRYFAGMIRPTTFSVS